MTVPGPVGLGYQPSHKRLGLRWAILSEAACQGEKQNSDQNFLGRAEKRIPVRPITDTRSKWPEVGSDTEVGLHRSWSHELRVKWGCTEIKGRSET